MVNQVLGIANWKRQLVLAGGLLVVLGAGVVMALTIQRLQKTEEPVLPKPEAAESWPNCTKNPSNEFKYTGDLSYLESCCSAIASTGDPFACTWPARGWCRPDQCPASGGQHCSLFYLVTPACSATCKVGGSILSDSQYPMTSQINVPTTPTFAWSYTEPLSGGTPYVNVRIWSCFDRTDDCMVFASAPAPWDTVPVASFYREPAAGKGTNFAAEWSGNNVKSLKPNTRYWWNLTWGVANCGVACVKGIPGDSRYPCESWGFITGAGEPECPAGKTKCGTSCVDLKTDPKNCGSCGNSCKVGESCVNSKCTAPAARTCSVTVAQTASGPSLTATAKGEGEANQAMRLWLEKQDGTRVTPLPSNSEEFNSLPDGGKYHYALGSCNATATKPCTVTKQPTNLAPGNYFAHCDIAIPLDAGKCSGNPFCSVNGGQAACTGWKSCSGTVNQRGGDNVAFAVSGSVSRSCTISVSGTTVTATGKGEKASNQAMRVWLEKSDGARITPIPTGTTERNSLPDGGKYHYSLGSCNTTATNPCTVSKQLTGLSAGSYTTHCDIAIPDDANRCTGNPFCSVNGGQLACTGWKSCSNNDKATLTVASTSCTKDSDCTNGDVCAYP